VEGEREERKGRDEIEKDGKGKGRRKGKGCWREMMEER